MDKQDEKVAVNEEVNLAEEVVDEKDLKIAELEALIEGLKVEVDSIKRAAADILNRSKQLEVDKKYASGDLVRKLLVPMSYFEGALRFKTEDVGLQNFLKGFDMVYNLIVDQLYTDGLKEIPTKVNDSFSPHIHDVSEIIEVSDQESDKILEVVQKGYYYKDRVIQPVKVKISQLKKENQPEDINEKVN